MKFYIIASLIASLLFLLMAGSASAYAPIIVNTTASLCDSAGYYADTYTVGGNSIDISGRLTTQGDITTYHYVRDLGAGSNLVWAEIWSLHANGTPNALLLNSTTTYDSSTFSGDAWYPFNYSGTVEPQPLFIGLGEEGGSGGSHDLGLCRSNSNDYSNGSIWVGVELSTTNNPTKEMTVAFGANYVIPASANVSFIFPTPADGATNNTNVTIGVNGTGGNVNLWFDTVNPPVALVVTNSSTPLNFTTNSSTNGPYYYKAGFSNNSLNTSVRTWTLDSTGPIININSNNGFSAANVTSSPFSNFLQLNITVTDNLALFAMSINITHPNGTSVFSYLNESMTGTNYTYSNLVDVSSWVAANYTTSISVSDTHTDEEIPSYRIDKPLGGGRLIFDTFEGNTIRIETELLATMTATKKKDRYEFDIDYFGSSTKSRTIDVKSDDAPINYFPNSRYKAHFVVGSAQGGNWIDFDGLPCDPTVRKITAYHYTVSCASMPDKVSLRSIGGLNVNSRDYLYQKNTLTIDSVTIVPGAPINLDDVQGFTTATNGLGNLINFSYRWYANGSLYYSNTSLNQLSNTSLNLDNISFTETTLGSNWTFSIMASSEGNSTPWLNSSEVTIAAQALNISIYDETTLALITQNVSILISADNYERTESTVTGMKLVGDLEDGENQLTFSADNYSTRTYTVTLSNATQEVHAYLASPSSELTFTVKDQNNGGFIENALATQYRIINSVWIPMESKYTDITGRIVFNYVAGAKYRFIIAKSGYETNTFELNPVVFSSYDVYLTPTSTVNATLDYDRLIILYSPQIFIEGNNSFLWVISSPFGELTSYGYTLTYPGGSSTASGSSSQGSQLNSTLNITGATALDRVQMDMTYTSTVAGVKNFTLYFPIITNSSIGTFEANRDNHYGLGILERILIMVISVIFVVGIATLIGRPLEGLGLGLLIMGWYVYIGFIEFWAIAISIVVGLIIISARSSD